MALIPAVIEAHNEYLEERESPIICNTDVRNVEWLDGALFFFPPKFARQTTHFAHSSLLSTMINLN